MTARLLASNSLHETHWHQSNTFIKNNAIMYVLFYRWKIKCLICYARHIKNLVITANIEDRSLSSLSSFFILMVIFIFRIILPSYLKQTNKQKAYNPYFCWRKINHITERDFYSAFKLLSIHVWKITQQSFKSHLQPNEIVKRLSYYLKVMSQSDSLQSLGNFCMNQSNERAQKPFTMKMILSSN